MYSSLSHTLSLLLFDSSIAFRHRSSWQDSARIKLNRADLVRYIWETTRKLGIFFQAPYPVQVQYNGGGFPEGTPGFPILAPPEKPPAASTQAAGVPDIPNKDKDQSRSPRLQSLHSDELSTRAVMEGE
jgi:hypothetical protein